MVGGWQEVRFLVAPPNFIGALHPCSSLNDTSVLELVFAPVMELVYVSDSKSEFCEFESRWGHQWCGGRAAQCTGLQILKTVSSNLTRTSKQWLVHIVVIIADCLSVDGSSILPRVAKFIGVNHGLQHQAL